MDVHDTVSGLPFHLHNIRPPLGDHSSPPSDFRLRETPFTSSPLLQKQLPAMDPAHRPTVRDLWVIRMQCIGLYCRIPDPTFPDFEMCLTPFAPDDKPALSLEHGDLSPHDLLAQMVAIQEKLAGLTTQYRSIERDHPELRDELCKRVEKALRDAQAPDDKLCDAATLTDKMTWIQEYRHRPLMQSDVSFFCVKVLIGFDDDGNMRDAPRVYLPYPASLSELDLCLKRTTATWQAAESGFPYGYSLQHGPWKYYHLAQWFTLENNQDYKVFRAKYAAHSTPSILIMHVRILARSARNCSNSSCRMLRCSS